MEGKSVWWSAKFVVMGYGQHHGLGRSVSLLLMGFGLVGRAKEMAKLLRIGLMCTTDAP